MSDREAFIEIRTAGLRVRHETREARAIRRATVDEAVAVLVAERDKFKPGYPGWRHFNTAIAKIREIGSRDPS